MNDDQPLEQTGWSSTTRQTAPGEWTAVGAHADSRSVTASADTEPVALLFGSKGRSRPAGPPEERGASRLLRKATGAGGSGSDTPP